MYNKEELEQMEPARLVSVASELGIQVSPTDAESDVIYAILNRQAEMAATSETQTKRKRTRITKAEKSAETEESETNAETPAKRRTRKTKAEAAAGDTVPTEEPVAAPKRRGRKPKAVVEAEAAAAAAAAESKAKETEEPVGESSGQQNDADGVNAEGNESTGAGIAQIASDAEEQNETEAMGSVMASNADADAEDQVWDGDPGDGTDFIIINDIPIEDTAATPILDMFDRPVMADEEPSFIPQMPDPRYAPQDPEALQTKEPKANFDFTDLISGNGVLEVANEGYGFLRSSDFNYLASPDDIYITQQQIKKYGLKTGDVVECMVRPPHDGEKYFVMTSVTFINGRRPEEVRDRIAFEHLTPLFPEEKFNLTGTPSTTTPSARIVDLFAPIGKGQRALIVAQPKTGKTMLMKDIANAIASNHPEAYIMMLLIDERPEEVTDMMRTVNAEVIASTFDEPADRHVKIAGIVLEKAKRMVECGHDVVIFLDSITRLARAYNTVAPASGKVLTGGVDANALQKPKRFFGAARNIEGGGSLTIIATALVDTGSKMDEVIFEEFKGTGNSEIQLDRMLSNKRIFPALNLVQSSTRRDDLLQDQTTLNRMWIIRKFISEMSALEAMNVVYDRLMHTKTNDEFLISMNG